MSVRCAFVFLLACSMGSAQNNASIVIVGAGVSGIAAASRLAQNNFTNVKIVEAEGRLGGRVLSVPFGDAWVDLGAEYCHGEEGNIVFSLAKDMLKSQQPDYELYYSGSGGEVGVDVQEHLFNLAHSIGHRKEYNSSKSDPCFGIISEGLCLKHNFDELLEKIQKEHKTLLNESYPWLRSYKSATESCTNLDYVSLVSDYEECKGDQMLHWQGRGFRTVLDLLGPLEEVEILLNSTVVGIRKWFNGSEVEVTLENSRKLMAEHVIFTPSLGVLKQLHQELFSPALPKGKALAIEYLGHGAIVKIALYFQRPWWMIHGSRIWGCIWSEEHVQELEKENLTWLRQFTAFTPAPGNPQVLMAWFAGDSANNIEHLFDYDVMRGVRFILSKCFLSYPDLDMPQRILRSTWWTNPNFRGSYSYDTVKGAILNDRKLRDKLGDALINEEGVPTLMFAGEATHPTMFATVHGAIESGHREAERLIQFYKKM